MSTRKDPFAKTRAENFRDRMARAQANMSAEQVEAAMKKIIRQKLANNEEISLDDFRLANLPLDHVQSRFRQVLKSVQNDMAADR